MPVSFVCSHDFVLELEKLLSQRVYGQHLVQDIVVNALKSHWNDKQKQKPLTLSFHGWPGGGKNYVTGFIVDSLYKLGSKSSYVHYFNGRIHFPMQSLTEQYQVSFRDSTLII